MSEPAAEAPGTATVPGVVGLEHLSEAEYADRARWRQLGIAMDLNEALPLPDGMYFDVTGSEDEPPEPGSDARDETRAAILRAFGLKPWHVGLAPVPRRVKLWNRITLRRWRVRIADWLDRES